MRTIVTEPTRVADPFLAAFTSDDDRRLLVEEFEHARAAGSEIDFDLLDTDTLHSLEPLLGDSVRVGLRIRGQRFIDPPRFVASLAHAVRARCARFGLVVHHHRAAVTQPVDAVDAPDQFDGAQLHLVLALGALKNGALFRLVRLQPGEVAIAHLRPRSGERQELAFLETLKFGHFVGSDVEQRRAQRPRRLPAVRERFVERAQHLMEPVAEVALVQFGVDLVGLLQAQLAKRKEAVGASAQVFIGARG